MPSLSAVARALSLSKQRLSQLGHESGFPGTWHGKRWQGEVEEVKAWLEARRELRADELDARLTYDAARRQFWRGCRAIGITPLDAMCYRDGCQSVEDLEIMARRLGFRLW